MKTTVFKGSGFRWPTVVACGLSVALLAAGCASTDNGDEGVAAVEEDPERARYGNLSDRGLEVQKADLNGSDQPDQWTYVDETGEVVRIERDMNFDGRVDLWQHYRGGELVEEEMSLDRTGRVDVVAFYEDGQLHRKEMATEFDRTFPIEVFYDSSGEVLRIERDSNGDGQPDVWEYYDDGERQRIGWDTSGDGQPDSFDRF